MDGIVDIAVAYGTIPLPLRREKEGRQRRGLDSSKNSNRDTSKANVPFLRKKRRPRSSNSANSRTGLLGRAPAPPPQRLPKPTQLLNCDLDPIRYWS